MVKQAFKICGFYSILENILPWMRRLWASNSTLIACSHGKGTQGMIAKWFCIKPLSWRILIIWATDPSPRILESVPLIFYARWGWITYMDRELALHPRSQNRFMNYFSCVEKLIWVCIVASFIRDLLMQLYQVWRGVADPYLSEILVATTWSIMHTTGLGQLTTTGHMFGFYLAPEKSLCRSFNCQPCHDCLQGVDGGRVLWDSVFLLGVLI